MTTRNTAAIFVLASAATLAARAEEGISDNSFLIEEAYNQEAGVVQHIQTLMYMKETRAWAYSFTQEWPVPGMKHQLSYTIPAFEAPGASLGIGDVLINYRYQALFDEHRAFSPRFSLVTPSGDYRKGQGADSWGYQVNLPLSLIVSPKLVTHWNLGATVLPDAREPGGAKARTTACNYGASAIYLATDTFNLMLEVAGLRYQIVQPDGSRAARHSLIVNPGFRYAFNYKSGLQIVTGLSVPFEVSASPTGAGVFAYLSFEHPFK
jgi:hypothetical protein